MPTIIQFPNLSVFVEGEEAELEQIADLDPRFMRMKSTKGKTILVNREQILFIETITDEAFSRLNVEMEKAKEQTKLAQVRNVIPFTIPRGKGN